MCVQEGSGWRKHTASGAGPLGSTLGHRKDQDPPVSEGIPHTHARVCAHTHVHARAYTYMCAHVCVHTCSYTHMHSHAYTHAHVCTHAYTGAYACMHTHTHVHTPSLPLSAHLTMNACSGQCNRGQCLLGLKLCPVSQGNAVIMA